MYPVATPTIRWSETELNATECYATQLLAEMERELTVERTRVSVPTLGTTVT
jgi:hypothetical protein